MPLPSKQNRNAQISYTFRRESTSQFLSRRWLSMWIRRVDKKHWDATSLSSVKICSACAQIQVALRDLSSTIRAWTSRGSHCSQFGMMFPANGSPTCKQRHPKNFWKSKCLIYMTCFGLGLKDTYRQISRRFPMRNLTNAWICPYDPAGCKCWGLLFYQYTST